MPMVKHFTPENDYESVSEKLLLIFEILPNEFFQEEGITPPKNIVENLKNEIRIEYFPNS